MELYILLIDMTFSMSIIALRLLHIFSGNPAGSLKKKRKKDFRFFLELIHLISDDLTAF